MIISGYNKKADFSRGFLGVGLTSTWDVDMGTGQPPVVFYFSFLSFVFY